MSEPIEEIASSRYAARLLAARPELAAELADPAAFSRDEMAHALAGAQHDDEAGLKRRFRRLRQRVLLRVMARDLAGRADLAEVCGTMSDLAERSEEHTSELQSRLHLVCRLLLEKKKKKTRRNMSAY